MLVVAVILQPLVTELEIVLHAEVPDIHETYRLVTIEAEHFDVVLVVSLPQEP